VSLLTFPTSPSLSFARPTRPRLGRVTSRRPSTSEYLPSLPGCLAASTFPNPSARDVDWVGLTNDLTSEIKGIVGITEDEEKTVVNSIIGILQGDDAAPANLLSVPSDVLVRLPPVVTPLLLGASAGLPGVNNVVILLLEILPILVSPLPPSPYRSSVERLVAVHSNCSHPPTLPSTFLGS
jgi:hypothetical protein